MACFLVTVAEAAVVSVVRKQQNQAKSAQPPVEYIVLGAEYLSPPLEDLTNGLYLGLLVVALSLIAWLIILIFKDPKGKVRAALTKI